MVEMDPWMVGQLLEREATRCGVLVMTGRIEARPGGRRELGQALLEWVAAARADGVEAHVYEDVEHSQAFCLVSRWASTEALQHHACHQPFGRLVGAIELLASQSVLTVTTGEGGHRGFRELRRRALAALAEAGGSVP